MSFPAKCGVKCIFFLQTCDLVVLTDASLLMMNDYLKPVFGMFYKSTLIKHLPCHVHFFDYCDNAMLSHASFTAQNIVFDAETQQEPRERSNFPETWIWTHTNTGWSFRNFLFWFFFSFSLGWKTTVLITLLWKLTIRQNEWKNIHILSA